jgi:2-phospho-L-lactate transferase CofD
MWLRADSPGPQTVDKGHFAAMDVPIQRIFYLDREGNHQEHEVYPKPNPAVLAELRQCDAIIYGMGSLYTSICPTLVLEVRFTNVPQPSSVHCKALLQTRT